MVQTVLPSPGSYREQMLLNSVIIFPLFSDCEDFIDRNWN